MTKVLLCDIPSTRDAVASKKNHEFIHIRDFLIFSGGHKEQICIFMKPDRDGRTSWLHEVNCLSGWGGKCKY